MKELRDYLVPFKSVKATEEGAHRTAVLIGDREAHRVLVAFESMPVTWTHPTTDAPADDRRLWEWLWKGVEIDFDALAERADAQEEVVQSKLTMLIAARQVFPDGSLGEYARGVMKTVIAGSIPKK